MSLSDRNPIALGRCARSGSVSESVGFPALLGLVWVRALCSSAAVMQKVLSILKRELRRPKALLIPEFCLSTLFGSLSLLSSYPEAKPKDFVFCECLWFGLRMT